MSLNINRWRVELSENDTESSLDYEDLDDSLFSSSAIRQIANTDHSRIPTQSLFSTHETTFRAYFPPWRPSTKLRNLKNHFDKTVLTQYPCVPCSYCSRLQYPTKARWELYDRDIQYPLEITYQDNPQVKLVFHTDSSKPRRIATCPSCYNSDNHFKIPVPDPVPIEIQNIPCIIGSTSHLFTSVAHLVEPQIQMRIQIIVI
jgi:hypothetical protein